MWRKKKKMVKWGNLFSFFFFQLLFFFQSPDTIPSQTRKLNSIPPPRLENQSSALVMLPSKLKLCITLIERIGYRLTTALVIHSIAGGLHDSEVLPRQLIFTLYTRQLPYILFSYPWENRGILQSYFVAEIVYLWLIIRVIESQESVRRLDNDPFIIAISDYNWPGKYVERWGKLIEDFRFVFINW